MSTTFKKPVGAENGQCETEQDAKEQERRDSRNRLREIRNIIREPQTSHIGDDLCQKAGIILQAQSLSLDAGSKCRPIFFSPYKGVVEDISDPDGNRRQYDEEDDEESNAHRLTLFFEDTYGDFWPEEATGSQAILAWDDIKCYDLHEDNRVYDWHVSGLAQAVQGFDESNPTPRIPPPVQVYYESNLTPHLPHIRCRMEHGVTGDGRLLRGEILAITRIMISRLKARGLEPHLMVPILIFSVMAPWHFRVLEAYFNGKDLVVRSTPLYDMREKREDHDFLDNLCRWWYGSYVGETKKFHEDSELVESQK